MLDVFCNSGGFSVYAAAGGARSVHSIDVSKYAIQATHRHMEMNRELLEFSATHSSHVGDAFDAMQDLVDQNERFDVIVVDPPSFAPNRASVPAARRAYQRLTALSVELLAKHGTVLLASCSSRIGSDEFFALVSQEIQNCDHQAVNTVRTGHALDHPIEFSQGAYLKAMLTGIART